MTSVPAAAAMHVTVTSWGTAPLMSIAADRIDGFTKMM
jgi:hypothetical protein